jgi:membrane-bound lytic murein transglycosylase D
LLLLFFSVVTLRAETPVEARATYIMETADSLVKARLALLDTAIMEHRFDKAVRQRIENYVGNWSNATGRLLARSARFFPIFEEQLLAAGMPVGLKYTAVQESALRPYATSQVGAGGLWQLMPGTARELGLTVNEIIDERLDPELGCAAGIEYLRLMYERYNDWALAIAAYNCGPGNVNRALRKAGGKNMTYWQIRQFLPRETRDHLPNIIAAAYVMAFHQLHDIPAAAMDLDLQLTEAITVDRRLSLHRVIQVTSLRAEIVVELNAQYLAGYLPGLPGGHRLHLPKRVMPAMRTYLSRTPANQAEADADLPWTSPRLHLGETNTDRHYNQYRTVAGPQDTTLRQVADHYQLPVDQLAVWSNVGEFDSLSTEVSLIFYGVGDYLAYDPRDRNTPAAAPLVEMLPAAPVRIPGRAGGALPSIVPFTSAKAARKPTFTERLKAMFQ